MGNKFLPFEIQSFCPGNYMIMFIVGNKNNSSIQSQPIDKTKLIAQNICGVSESMRMLLILIWQHPRINCNNKPRKNYTTHKHA